MKSLKAKHGMKKISQLAKIKGAYSVKVGVIRGTGVHPGPTKKTSNERKGQESNAKERTATIAEIAWWNEFGTRNGIPERPFLRMTMRENRYYRAYMRQILRKIMLLQTKMDAGLRMAGAKAASDIRKMITTGNFVPNSPATIRRKSTSAGRKARPLIDTGLLRKSITYQLSHEMGTRMIGEQ